MDKEHLKKQKTEDLKVAKSFMETKAEGISLERRIQIIQELDIELMSRENNDS